MTAYEYKHIAISHYGQSEAIESDLNRYGAEGWRVIDMRWHASAHDHVLATLERQTQSKKEIAELEALLRYELQRGEARAAKSDSKPPGFDE